MMITMIIITTHMKGISALDQAMRYMEQRVTVIANCGNCIHDFESACRIASLVSNPHTQSRDSSDHLPTICYVALTALHYYKPIY